MTVRWSRVASLLVLVSSGLELARGEESSGVWSVVARESMADQAAESWVRPEGGTLVSVDVPKLREVLSRAPARGAGALAGGEGTTISLPMPDGTERRFSIVSSSIMADALAARYPEIRTFVGQGIDDPTLTVRCDLTPAGFHAQILGWSGAVYIDPYSRPDTGTYACYTKPDLGSGSAFSCGAVGGPPLAGIAEGGGARTSGDMLSTYRLAVAATGEYTGFHGGTVIDGLAAIVTAVNRVAGIYEQELAVSFELVADNDAVVFTNPATDPYTNNNPSVMLSQNQSAINAFIGASNYDVGHVFGTGGGGIAGFGVVCGSQKARGVTGTGNPVGDGFYVDYVAHEMGHQFGGDHSFNGINGSCGGGNRNGSTAYEPGSGSTIMAYAGICGAFDNLQSNSDAYFHWISHEQIRSFVGGQGSLCGVLTMTGNSPPVVDAGPDYVIPRQTPFALTAGGSDPDLDPITYCWEERDLGPGQSASGSGSADNGSSPIFRSFSATDDPTRVFPRLSNLLNNTTSIGEQLPNTNRLLRFRVTARDNRAGGGGAGSDDMQLSVHFAAGPFTVTSPNTAVVWGGTRIVTWNVAGTNAAPVNATLVDILLSTNGGLTFPVVLVSGTANDGSEAVSFPVVTTSTARVKVSAVGNVFFDVSNVNFSLDPSAAVDAPSSPPYPESELKHRYLTLEPNNLDSVAIRVEQISGPGGGGVLGWLDVPADPGCPAACTGRMVSRVVADPVFRVWTESIVDVADCEIVPAASYELRVTLNGSLFSEPLVVSTSPAPSPRFFGDVVGPFFVVEWTAPDGLANFNDISAVVQGFQHVVTAPPLTWADLGDEVPDGRVDFRDINLVVRGFQGLTYPFSVPIACP